MIVAFFSQSLYVFYFISPLYICQQFWENLFFKSLQWYYFNNIGLRSSIPLWYIAFMTHGYTPCFSRLSVTPYIGISPPLVYNTTRRNLLCIYKKQLSFWRAAVCGECFPPVCLKPFWRISSPFLHHRRFCRSLQYFIIYVCPAAAHTSDYRALRHR